MKFRSLRTRGAASIAGLYILLAVLAFGAFRWVSDGIVPSLGTCLATRQALLEKSKQMSKVQRDLSPSIKMAASPISLDWVLAQDDQGRRERELKDGESYRKAVEGKSLFLALNESTDDYTSDGRDDQVATSRYTLSPENQNDALSYRTMSEVDSYEPNVGCDNHLDVNKVWRNGALRDA